MTDEILYTGISNCCGAPIYANTDICSECKEHCEEAKEQE